MTAIWVCGFVAIVVGLIIIVFAGDHLIDPPYNTEAPLTSIVAIIFAIYIIYSGWYILPFDLNIDLG